MLGKVTQFPLSAVSSHVLTKRQTLLLVSWIKKRLLLLHWRLMLYTKCSEKGTLWRDAVIGPLVLCFESRFKKEAKGVYNKLHRYYHVPVRLHRVKRMDLCRKRWRTELHEDTPFIPMIQSPVTNLQNRCLLSSSAVPTRLKRNSCIKYRISVGEALVRH